MSDESSIWQAIGGAIVGIASGGALVGEWFRRKGLRASRDQVEIAENDRDRSAAMADQRSIDRLIARIEWLEDDARKAHHEMAAMRRLFRHAEDHIAELQRALRAAGIQFTPYEPLRLDQPG